MLVYEDLLNGDELLSDTLLRNRVLKVPKTDPSLYWGKRKGQTHRHEDLKLISEGEAHLNKFSNDGSFMLSKQKNESVETKNDGEGTLPNMESVSVNQLAAKALQFRLKGKLEEAQKLMEEAERLKASQADSSKEQHYIRAARYPIKDARKNEDDMHLARSIMQNKQYKTSNQAADDEYDYGDAPRKMSRKRGRSNVPERESPVKRILTQEERCLFCFENPKRPKHLVVSIANFTYLMLPQHQPLVPGHCCILTMQHEAASRSVDDNVWGEIRNFKKCLIMMFAKAGKDVVFLETVTGLSQQRRHCLIECIPIPQEIAKQGPLYFKKAIDEAESEWNQHNAKKLIDTSVKGLRNSIPESFPYFHVEFGLDKGFAHVIGDEKRFNSNLGLNVIRVMLELPEQDMYRRTRHESVENQKKAAEWELHVAEQTAMFADALSHCVGPHHQPSRQSQLPSSPLEPSSSPDPSESPSEMSESPPKMPQYPQCSACGARGFHFHWCTRPGDPRYKEPYQLVPPTDYCQIGGNDGHFAPIRPIVVPGSRMSDPSCASIPEPHRARPNRPDPGPSRPSFVPSVACQLCGNEGHLAPACPRRPARARTTICQLCRREGHTARLCLMAEPHHIATPPCNTHFQHPPGTPVSSFFCEPYCRLCGAFRSCWRR